MTNTQIQLVCSSGEPLGRLRLSAFDLIVEAEQVARTRNLLKRTAIPLALRERLEEAGYEIDEQALSRAAQSLDAVRRGEPMNVIQVVVSITNKQPKIVTANKSDIKKSPTGENQMGGRQASTQILQFFELERIYPHADAQAWYDRLVGIDDHKSRLLIELEMLLYPEKLDAWSQKHHGHILRVCELQRNRVPLILLEGDVGTGKTALAETVGDALARKIGGNSKVHLLKINTQVRGAGHVGEMSDLIVQAFTQAEAHAKSLNDEPLLLLLDEADALASRRDNQQMHHEDKAGLNTLLQRIDNLRLTRQRIAVIFITNRPEALDPAVRRRAALDLFFERPNDLTRREIIVSSIPELTLSREQVNELLNLTGTKTDKNKGIPFTASDITDRLLPAALREAYSQGRELSFNDLLLQAAKLEPSPPM